MQCILYNKPCVLFRYENGYAYKYDGEIKDLGNIKEDKAIYEFKRNFEFDHKCA
jgi:hypothetical protein